MNYLCSVFLCSGVPIYSICGLYCARAQIILSLPISQQHVQMLMFAMALAQIVSKLHTASFSLSVLIIFPKKEQ